MLILLLIQAAGQKDSECKDQKRNGQVLHIFDLETFVKLNILDRKLILFICSCGMFLILLGSVLLILHSLYSEQFKYIQPAIVIGKSILNKIII